MRENRQCCKQAFDDHAHIRAGFGRCDQYKGCAAVEKLADNPGRLFGKLFQLARIDVELDDFALRVALQRLVEHHVPLVAEAQHRQHAVVGQVAANLLRHADAHMLNDLLGLAHMRREFGNGFENEMQVADRDALGKQQLQHGLQAVLKLLLAERVSIRNLHLILEAVAELAPHVRKTEQIVEHVRIRMAQQICGDLTDNGVLPVLRLGNKWDMVFHQALKRDSKGEIVEFDIDPRQLEEFSEQATRVIREFLDRGTPFVLVTSPESRSYVRMIIERLFATLPVLSHVELAKGIEIKILGSIS